MSKKQVLEYQILPDPTKNRLPPFNADDVPKLPQNPYNNFLDIPRTPEYDIQYYMKTYKSELLMSLAAIVVFIIYKKYNK